MYGYVDMFTYVTSMWTHKHHRSSMHSWMYIEESMDTMVCITYLWIHRCMYFVKGFMVRDLKGYGLKVWVGGFKGLKG